MKLLGLTLAVAMLGTPALAQSGYSAQVANPKQPSYDLLLESVTWRCDNGACQTTSDLNGANDADSCEDLAKKVGVLSSFAGDRPFTPKQLAACNKAAPVSRESQASLQAAAKP